MQAILIISAVIVFAAALCFSLYRGRLLNAIAHKIDDPKLRITAPKSIFVWLFMLLGIAALISIIWLCGSYNRLYNYEGAFTLRPVDRWSLVEAEKSGSEQDFTYVDIYNDYLHVNIVSLNPANAKSKRTEIRQTRKNLTQMLKQEPNQLKKDAKTAEKEIKAQAKKNEKELKLALKGKKEELKTAITANKEQRDLDIKNVKLKLEQDIANNKIAQKKIWQNGWLRPEREKNSFIALQNRNLYTVDFSSNGRLASVMDIGPSGFFTGIFNGSIFPITAFLANSSDSVYPYRKINNGFSYGAGFVLGVIVLMAFIGWLLFIIIAKIKRDWWKKEWPTLPTEAKVAYITVLYKDEQKANAKYLEKAKQISTDQHSEFKATHGMTPDNAIKVYDAPPEEKGKWEKIGETLADVFTAKGFSKGAAEKEYNKMKMVYDCYASVYNIADAQVQAANSHYKFICIKSVLYIQQLKELIDKFNYEQKKEFNLAEQMELDKIEFNNLKVSELLSQIESLNKTYDKQTKALWNGTLKFANSVSSISRLGSLGPALGIGAIVVAGALTYFSSVSKNEEIMARLKEGLVDIRKAITQSKENKLKAEAFVKRADEICSYLDESIKRYTVMFAKISAELFPENNAFRSRLQRSEREKKGEGYYTNEEFLLIKPLGRYAKIMGQVIEADL